MHWYEERGLESGFLKLGEGMKLYKVSDEKEMVMIMSECWLDWVGRVSDEVHLLTRRS